MYEDHILNMILDELKHKLQIKNQLR